MLHYLNTSKIEIILKEKITINYLENLQKSMIYLIF